MKYLTLPVKDLQPFMMVVDTFAGIMDDYQQRMALVKNVRKLRELASYSIRLLRIERTIASDERKAELSLLIHRTKDYMTALNLVHMAMTGKLDKMLLSFPKSRRVLRQLVGVVLPELKHMTNTEYAVLVKKLVKTGELDAMTGFEMISNHISRDTQ